MIRGMGMRAGDLVKRRWRRFYRPYPGTKRTLSPLKWEWRDRILVGGELLALSAAIAAIPVELIEWMHASWLIIGAAIVGAGALSWYAFDLISAGELPLTNRSVKNIRAVMIAMEMEADGVKLDWSNATKDDGIPMDMCGSSVLSDWTKSATDEAKPVKIFIGDTLIGTIRRSS